MKIMLDFAYLIYFISRANKANRRHIKAILRSFNASFRKSLNAITSLSVSRFARSPLRVLKTFLCHNYYDIKVSITQLLYKLIYIEKAAISDDLIYIDFSPKLRTSSYASTNCLERKVIFSQLRQIATVLLHNI